MDETILRIQFLSLSIGNKTDISALRNVLFNVLHDFSHDRLAQAFALMLLEHSNVHDLIEAPAVAYDAAHADWSGAEKHLHGEQCVRQASFCGFSGLAA